MVQAVLVLEPAPGLAYGQVSVRASFLALVQVSALISFEKSFPTTVALEVH
jgi:hypothetical protein